MIVDSSNSHSSFGSILSFDHQQQNRSHLEQLAEDLSETESRLLNFYEGPYLFNQETKQALLNALKGTQTEGFIPRGPNCAILEVRMPLEKKDLLLLKPFLDRNHHLSIAEQKYLEIGNHPSHENHDQIVENLSVISKSLFKAIEIDPENETKLIDFIRNKAPKLVNYYLDHIGIQEFHLINALFNHSQYDLLATTLFLDDGPFLNSPERRLILFFASAKKILLNHGINLNENNFTFSKLIEKFFFKEQCEVIKARYPGYNWGSSIEAFVQFCLQKDKASVLEREQQSPSLASLNAEQLVNEIENLQRKECSFRQLLSSCQDYRYRSNTEGLNRLKAADFEQTLLSFFPNQIERLWVLNHLVIHSQASPMAYTPSLQSDRLHLGGWGLSLRKDGIRLNEIQQQHYAIIKELGIKCIESMPEEERKKYGRLIKLQLPFFDLHLSSYQRAIDFSTHTNARKKVNSLLSASDALSITNVFSANIKTLSYLYIEAHRERHHHSQASTSLKQQMSGVKRYYKGLVEQLKIQLLVEKLLATHQVEGVPSLAQKSFSLILEVVECGAYIVPPIGAAVHATGHALEISHALVLAATHASSAFMESREFFHGHADVCDELKNKNPKTFIKRLCLELTRRFRKELKLLDRHSIDGLVNMHRDHLLDRIGQAGSLTPLPSASELHNALIDELDPRPLECALAQIGATFDHWPFLQKLRSKIEEAENNPQSRDKLIDIYHLVKPIFSSRPNSSSAHLNLTHPILSFIHTNNEQPDLGIEDGNQHHEPAAMPCPFLIDLSERIALLMLRQMVLVGTFTQSNMQREIDEAKMVEEFIYSYQELMLLKKIEEQREKLEEQTERIAKLEHAVNALQFRIGSVPLDFRPK